MQGGGARVIGRGGRAGGEMGRVGEGEGRRVESRPRLIVKELVGDVGGGRHPDSGFSDSSDSSVVVEDEAEVKVTKRRGEKDRGENEEKEDEKDRTVRRRAEKEGAVGGLSVSFYSVTDMIRDRSLQLDINSNLFTSECLTTSFMDAEEGEEELDKVGLSEKRPKVGRSNPVPGHLRGLAEVMGGKGGLGDLDGMDCPLQAWLGGPQGSGGGGPVDSWLGEVRGVQEAECSTMLQSKPIRWLKLLKTDIFWLWKLCQNLLLITV